ncbi:hypothetical protein ACRFHR_27730, partial [Klebsiella pneumoniae]
GVYDYFWRCTMTRRLMAAGFIMLITFMNWLAACSLSDDESDYQELAKKMFLESALPAALVVAITV